LVKAIEVSRFYGRTSFGPSDVAWVNINTDGALDSDNLIERSKSTIQLRFAKVDYQLVMSLWNDEKEIGSVVTI
jgi:hypothetical protein